MMTMLYSVHDKAVGAFMPLFPSRSNGEAIRSFMGAVTSDKGPFASNRSDYVLYCVGSFDDVSGRLAVIEPERLMSALEAFDASSV